MKIVFIINSLHAPRCIKRVNEFIERGFEIEAFAFSRKENERKVSCEFKINIIGEYSNKTSFYKRLPLLYFGIRSVVNLYKDRKDIIFYLFQLDVAMVFNSLSFGQKYIYEESDLMHTYIRNIILNKLFEKIDRYIIRNSLLSIFTSEGFVKYHYGDIANDKCIVIPNRLNKDILNFNYQPKKDLNIKKLKIGFVGGARFKSVFNFVKTYCEEFPYCEFHFFGYLDKNSVFNLLDKYPNCYFHGAFKNPDDLPIIYSQIDLVLSSYDTEFENVKYAEPNKLYEAIYFETPIIVSKGTFLEQKVNSLGIGYSIDPLDDSSIIDFINNLTAKSIDEKKYNCSIIEKSKCLNINDNLFVILNELI